MNGAWIVSDREELRKIMAAWENDGNPTAHPGRAFKEPSHTSSDTPAYFTAWQMAGYSHVGRGYLDGDEGPERTGHLRVLFWLQPSKGRSILDSLYVDLVAKIDTFDTPLNFFPPTPVEDTLRTSPTTEKVWHVEGLEFPFVQA